ncbi:MAG: hypothetical protein KGH76_06225 [Thaumarchaeota archaeon]|nr:hypothetical protein [Nitrososphaerota archaeon]MDE1842970.1 hypothetical protein [Nitrososphaerota archaeon]
MSSTGSQRIKEQKRDRTTLQYDKTTSKMLYYDAKFHGRSKVQQLRELVKADIQRYNIAIPARDSFGYMEGLS